MNDALANVRALRVDGNARSERDDIAAAEVPIALLCNGEPFAVMMATPCDLEDFALGFALTEGVVAQAGEFRLVDIVRDEAGIALHAAIPQARYDAMRARTLEGRSGCGLCGVATLQDALRPVPRVSEPRVASLQQVREALAALEERQPLNAQSGGVHAAGFAHAGGLLVREDVGRHNALDKLVGAMRREQLDPACGFLVVTSRASYEIVHKAAMADIGIVIAISAPSELAIRTAQSAGITLAAFARGDAMNLYTAPHRIALAG